MSSSQRTTRLHLGEIATIQLPAYCPPTRRAEREAFTVSEIWRIFTDGLGATSVSLRSFLSYIWGRGMTSEELAERTTTLEVPITPVASAPYSFSLKRYQLVLAAMTLLLAGAVLVNFLVNAPVAQANSNGIHTRWRVTANPHPCALYHYPTQAPAHMHCVVLYPLHGKANELHHTFAHLQKRGNEPSASERPRR